MTIEMAMFGMTAIIALVCIVAIACNRRFRGRGRIAGAELEVASGDDESTDQE